jgi:hypothetical protein
MKAVLNPFELKVMKLALRGNAPWIIGMRDQLSHLTVIDRRSDGSGFKTDFHCANTAAPVDVPRGNGEFPVNGYPPAINAKRSKPIEGLVSFIVWLGDDGRIRQLEACPLTDDQWPDDLFSSFYAFQDDEGNIIQE